MRHPPDRAWSATKWAAGKSPGEYDDQPRRTSARAPHGEWDVAGVDRAGWVHEPVIAPIAPCFDIGGERGRAGLEIFQLQALGRWQFRGQTDGLDLRVLRRALVEAHIRALCTAAARQGRQQVH